MEITVLPPDRVWFNEVYLLAADELYEDAYKLGSEVASRVTFDQLAAEDKLKLSECLGQVAGHLQIYKRAVYHLNRALSVIIGSPRFSDRELPVRWRLHQNYIHLGLQDDALRVLEKLTTRPPKVNAALAKLYELKGRKKLAASCYTEFLKERPLALVTAQHCVERQHLSGEDVLALTSALSPSPPFSHWLVPIFEAIQLLASGNIGSNKQALTKLEGMTCTEQSPLHMGLLTQAYMSCAYYCQAEHMLLKLRTLDPTNPHMMDLYAYLLYLQNKPMQMQQLSAAFEPSASGRAEPWIIAAYAALNAQNSVKAAQLASFAITLAPDSIHALLCKAYCLYQNRTKFKEALRIFDEVICRAPDLFEAYKGKLDCLLLHRNTTEAKCLVSQLHQQNRQDPRYLGLCGMVFSDQSGQTEMAKKVLAKAIQLDPDFTDAALLLAQQLMKEHKLVEALALLQQALRPFNEAKVRKEMARCYIELQEFSEAIRQLHTVLSLDPHNTAAKAALEQISKWRNLSPVEKCLKFDDPGSPYELSPSF